MRLARLTALAEYVWETEAHAHEFMRGEQPQLGARPIDLVRTELGRREVEDPLLRILPV